MLYALHDADMLEVTNKNYNPELPEVGDLYKMCDTDDYIKINKITRQKTKWLCNVTYYNYDIEKHYSYEGKAHFQKTFFYNNKEKITNYVFLENCYKVTFKKNK